MEKKVVKVEKINNIFYTSTSNLTKLSVKKDYLNDMLKSNHIEQILKSLAFNVFDDENLYNKQKIVAFTNLVRSVKRLVDKKEEFTLNVIIKMLNAHHKTQKNIKYFVNNKELGSVQTFIKLAYDRDLHATLKDVYTSKEK
ncbi:hypothetical protein [Halarcobacter sp.]|uniref:hypothetical protein n=1 Tax=Halarcobacter sp. TaxID=2321133 RepID=UPI003B000A06